MISPIAISVSPNAEKDDVFLAFKMLLNPFVWFDNKKVVGLEKKFEKSYPNGFSAFAVNSGRSALYIILKALGLGVGDEVIIQAFTCVAVPNSIIWTGAKPIYVDIDASYNIEPNDLKKKITSKTKAIIIQNTFGIPADYDAIKKMLRRSGREIVIIEDCAHSLGALYKNKKVGTLGNIAFFSLGRDKVISSVFGGMILTQNEELKARIKKLVASLENPSNMWVFQQLLHPLFFYCVKPFYSLKITRVLVALVQRLGIISKAIYAKEKLSQKPVVFPQKMAGALAVLALHQFEKLTRFTTMRSEIVDIYKRKLKDIKIGFPEERERPSWLRYPVRMKNAHELFKFAQFQQTYLGDWYKSVVTPTQDLSLVSYRDGSCPIAERYVRETINLPTYPLMRIGDAARVVHVIRKWENLSTK